MSDKRFPANIISSTPVEPTGSFQDDAASGTWSLQEAFTYVKAGLWPIAGNQKPLIEDVFSTYLYTGNGTSQTITNGIDLAGEGGMVWTKGRSLITNQHIVDTERGAGDTLFPNTDGAEFNADTVTGFLGSGFTLGNNSNSNANGETFASWTFRKAPRFFDLVTWTGTGQSSIAHNLGVKPACIIFKRTDGTENWIVYHQNLTTPNANWWDNAMNLNTTIAGADVSGGTFLTQEPDENNVYIGSFFNPSNKIYVAYLFAHDPLGPSGDGSDGLIACGSFTSDGSGNATIDLGWEPQWVLRKNSGTAGSWSLYDNMRGLGAGAGTGSLLIPNLTIAEVTGTSDTQINSTGINFSTGENNNTYIYIAIRRGPMRAPESGTEVFGVKSEFEPISSPVITQSGVLTDLVIHKPRLLQVENWFWSSRLQGDDIALSSNNTAAEADYGSIIGDGFWKFDNNEYAYIPAGGYYNNGSGGEYAAYSFNRAPGYFDAVAYTGTGSAITIPHNLAVKPEMIIQKRRNAADSWHVFVEQNGWGLLESSGAWVGTGNGSGTDTIWQANASTIALTSGFASAFAASGSTNIAYLFATLPGVSKVGSYTGNGSSQTIDCGFTSGARFVLIKRTDSTGNWYVWDSARGIVAGNDPHLSLNSTAAEVTTDDSVDAESSGFIVNQDAATNVNVNTASYIFLAIA